MVFCCRAAGRSQFLLFCLACFIQHAQLAGKLVLLSNQLTFLSFQGLKKLWAQEKQALNGQHWQWGENQVPESPGVVREILERLKGSPEQSQGVICHSSHMPDQESRVYLPSDDNCEILPQASSLSVPAFLPRESTEWFCYTHFIDEQGVMEILPQELLLGFPQKPSKDVTQLEKQIPCDPSVSLCQDPA